MQITAMQIEFVHIMIISLIYDTKYRIKTTQIIWQLSFMTAIILFLLLLTGGFHV